MFIFEREEIEEEEGRAGGRETKNNNEKTKIINNVHKIMEDKLSKISDKNQPKTCNVKHRTNVTN
jgi:hypothetical protein